MLPDPFLELGLTCRDNGLDVFAVVFGARNLELFHFKLELGPVAVAGTDPAERGLVALLPDLSSGSELRTGALPAQQRSRPR